MNIQKFYIQLILLFIGIITAYFSYDLSTYSNWEDTRYLPRVRELPISTGVTGMAIISAASFVGLAIISKGDSKGT